MSAIKEAVLSLFALVSSLIPHSDPVTARVSLPLYLHNTLTGTKDLFTPLSKGVVKMYNCGPTVYAQQHVGNLSMFVFVDILRRVLEANGFAVRQVINFTDVGHLVSDGDDGDDKMTKGLKQAKLALTLENMKKLGKKYADVFLEDLRTLGIDTETITFPYASDYIAAQIAMVRTLEEKGYAYVASKGVYFDTARFPTYGKLGNIDLSGLKEGARVESDPDKRHPIDFILWKRDEKIGWDSPWGKGFPGWHIECSAMSHSILGDQLDIHTGGIEHIPVHHNNEIAQSEAALGKKPFARFWLHRAHLQIEGSKIAKSKGNTIYLSDIVSKGFHPLAFRYLLLGSHYRTNASFTWEALESAQQAFLRLRRLVDTLPAGGIVPSTFTQRFMERLNDDIDTAGAVAHLWEVMKDKNLSGADLRAIIVFSGSVLGLGFDSEDAMARGLWEKIFGSEVALQDAPQDVRDMVGEREKARESKDWAQADILRDRIEKAGFTLEDAKEGVRLIRK